MPEMPGGFGAMPGMGGQQNCPAFRCSGSSVPVPKRPLRLTSTGCSGMGGMQMFSVQSAGEDDILTSCCDQRHACFSICGASRSKCEANFKACSENTCAAIPNSSEREKCESSSKLQVMMSGMGDCRDFTQAQNNACQCAQKDKVLKKFEALLRDFYKKHSPDKVDQVSVLANKADGSIKKFAALMIKLVGKYPKAIKRVKDPQQDWYENLMKETKEKGADADTPEEYDESESEVIDQEL